MSEALKLKVGLLVVGAVILLLLTVIWLGTGEVWEERIICVTYFSESVVGLDEGSLVRFRGIPFGRISRISIAPDREHVALQFEVLVKNLDPETVRTLKNLDKEDWTKNGLRMRIGSQGFTGLKFLEGDILDPKQYAPEKLAFRTPSNYIPSAPSAFTNLERSALRILQSIEAADVKGIADGIKTMLASIDRLIGDLRGKVDGVGDLLESARQALVTLETEVAAMSRSARDTMKNADAALKSIDSLAVTTEGTIRDMKLPDTMKTVQSSVGKLGDASDKIGAAADSLSGTFQDLRGDLRVPLLEMERTLQSLRTFVNYLERNPAALIHGRTDK
jgi:paraquat-inducible protein B